MKGLNSKCHDTDGNLTLGTHFSCPGQLQLQFTHHAFLVQRRSATTSCHWVKIRSLSDCIYHIHDRSNLEMACHHFDSDFSGCASRTLVTPTNHTPNYVILHPHNTYYNHSSCQTTLDQYYWAFRNPYLPSWIALYDNSISKIRTSNGECICFSSNRDKTTKSSTVSDILWQSDPHKSY